MSVDYSVQSKYFSSDLEENLNPDFTNSFSQKILEIEKKLVLKLTSENIEVKLNPPVEYIYNPLEYAFEVHSNFVNKFCNEKKQLLFLGMNPGPWGMMQTGVPFGDINTVKNWLKLSGNITEPHRQHPNKRVKGFDCKRVEVSGKRFWSLAQHLSNNNPNTFFSNSFLHNYFPLVLLSSTGKNITPADLKSSDQKLIQNICNESLLEILAHLQVKYVIAIGRFAERRVVSLLKNKNVTDIKVVYISHPSPRNPASNKDWLHITLQHLNNFDLIKYFT
ncbi:single-strand-selective monofunctional uracil-DNA glycosylase [Lycorma delicatula]|uniref:single-strand-selective monofunctional uracil-DNA glycosylase n=1 Tax=Lycorma delicatula TaxID=130591 RepID=UPI003F514229